ncbi:MAG TPA: ABC transporter permease [Acidimicrobiales bacterium]|nr:ABC transporter permease [Acidimicrobiales bacterium]
MRAWWAQTRAEVVMTLRRGETLLVTLGLPVGLLVVFSTVKIATSPTRARVDFVAPGVLALAVLSTSLTALSIATGFERAAGVLRRLRVTPLSTRRLVAAKCAGVLVTEAIQVAVLAAVALGLGWHPHGGGASVAQGAAVLVLGSLGAAGIGLYLAGRLRAEVNLAATNGLYVALLLVSGLVVPLTSYPSWVARLATALPPGAMAQALDRLTIHALAPTGGDWMALVLWALGAPLLAARSFSLD